MEIKSKRLETELDILRKNSEDGTLVIDDYIEPLNKIYEIFSSQGHSGFSAPYYSRNIINGIKCMLEHDILSPLTGDEDEWNIASFDGWNTIAITDDNETKKEADEIQKLLDDATDIVYQNKRLNGVFKHGNNITYQDAIVWREDGVTFTGEVEGINSTQPISFPFTPKTFYIDVIRDYHDLDWFIENNIPYYIEDADDNGESLYYRSIVKDKRKLKEVRKLYKFKAEL